MPIFEGIFVLGNIHDVCFFYDDRILYLVFFMFIFFVLIDIWPYFMVLREL